MTFFLPDEQHTLASALRDVLERAHPDEYVACTLQHPQDTFLRVDAPNEASVRRALLTLKDEIAEIRNVNSTRKSRRTRKGGGAPCTA